MVLILPDLNLFLSFLSILYSSALRWPYSKLNVVVACDDMATLLHPQNQEEQTKQNKKYL